MKKKYIKPTIQVVKIQQSCQILAGSVGANGLTNTDGLGWKFGGFDDEEGDY
jgi:hypothetical protein